jgi:hypothetical protein
LISGRNWRFHKNEKVRTEIDQRFILKSRTRQHLFILHCYLRSFPLFCEGNQAQIWLYLETPQSKFHRDACQKGISDENLPNVNKNKAPKKGGQKVLLQKEIETTLHLRREKP